MMLHNNAKRIRRSLPKTGLEVAQLSLAHNPLRPIEPWPDTPHRSQSRDGDAIHLDEGLKLGRNVVFVIAKRIGEAAEYIDGRHVMIARHGEHRRGQPIE